MGHYGNPHPTCTYLVKVNSLFDRVYILFSSLHNSVSQMQSITYLPGNIVDTTVVLTTIYQKEKERVVS